MRGIVPAETVSRRLSTGNAFDCAVGVIAYFYIVRKQRMPLRILT